MKEPIFVTARYFFGMAVFLALSAGVLASTVRAEESQFDYVYTTDLLPENQRELMQWGTYSTGQEKGTFNLLQGRTGFEYGVADNFQVAVYANYAHADARGNGVTGATQEPSAIAGAAVGTDGLNAARYTGTTLEGIYRVLSPYEDGVGLAVLVEPTVGHNLLELDNRLILQKNYLDDRLVFAGNVEWIGEKILPTDASGWEPHSVVVLSAASSFRFVPDWSAGLEFVNQRDFGRIGVSDRLDSVSFFGPSIHYGGETYFVTLGVLAQLPIAEDYANSALVQDGRLLAPNFSKYQGRLKFGYYF